MDKAHKMTDEFVAVSKLKEKLDSFGWTHIQAQYLHNLVDELKETATLELMDDEYVLHTDYIHRN